MGTGRRPVDGPQRDGPERALPAARQAFAQERAGERDGRQQRARAGLEPDRGVAAWIERLVALHAHTIRPEIGGPLRA